VAAACLCFGISQGATAGEDRALRLYNLHTHEKAEIVFKRDGVYDQNGLNKLNEFLRDWRLEKFTKMDPHLFDLVWEVYRESGSKDYINVICGFRSPDTNAMLRRRSKGVAENSLHMQGKAMDFAIPDVDLAKLRVIGLRLQVGGVGFYPTSGSPFVHMDTGNVRHWPRMTHDQLVRVFPNGRTVHVPTDGKPLAGYELAAADIERRKNGEAGASSGKSFLASLFSRRQQPSAAEDADEGTPAKPGVIARAAETIKDKAEALTEKIAEAVPLPRAKPKALAAVQPVATYQVASAADTTPLPPVRPQAESKRPLTPADIINTRAFWDDTIAMPKQASPEQVAALRARNAVAQADPLSTASLPREVAQALAFAPAAHERPHVVAARAPMPMTPRQRLAATHALVETVVAKSRHGQPSAIATIAPVAAASQMNHFWTRAMMMTPNVTTSLSATSWVERDMTRMVVYFAKPERAVAMSFTSDPQMGLVSTRFTDGGGVTSCGRAEAT
jgi:uncharacterized protein YcbK (DUF882 family)